MNQLECFKSVVITESPSWGEEKSPKSAVAHVLPNDLTPDDGLGDNWSEEVA